jgi:hypothetical protein
MITIAERVAKGVVFLDEHKPDWWKPESVNLATLNQRSSDCCIIAQNYDNNYWKGLRALGLNTGSGIEHGFDQFFERAEADARESTKEWKRIILERRSGVSYTVDPQVVITSANIEAAKDILREFTSQSPTYAGDLTDTGVLYAVLDSLGVLPLVKS